MLNDLENKQKLRGWILRQICCYNKSIFYKKNNFGKSYPYNDLEHDISSMINEGNIFFLGNFNAKTTSINLLS